jgi:hypothetical protein
MDFERLEHVWRSGSNSLAPTTVSQLTEKTMKTLKQRQSAFNAATGLVAVVLVLWTGRVAWEAISNPFPFDPVQEWGTVLLGVVPWIALFTVRALHERRMKAHPDPYVSLPDTLRALMAENVAARRRLWTLAAFGAAFGGVLALSLRQLVEVGKMTPADAAQGGLLFGCMAALVVVLTVFDVIFRLVPEGRRLRSLVADCEQS